MPEDSTPIRVEKMKMPAIVTSRPTMRKPQPVSPATVPASIERIRLSHMASGKSTAGWPSGASCSPTSRIAAMTMTISDSTASQPISATGPADIEVSKA